MLNTEKRNHDTTNIDSMNTYDMVAIMNKENLNCVNAVETVLPEIAKAIEIIAEAFQHGGRLFYIGAGTSGRLGVLDAAECPPTFGVPNGLVNAILAGGEKCMTKAAEGEEDDALSGENDISTYNIQPNDVVVGISAAGGASYVIGALTKAKSAGCTTIGITSNADSVLSKTADIAICPDTGAEVITGSTRLKAGTAQKLILNMLSTGAMIKTGKVYENLMINVRPVNQKLHKRCIRIIRELASVDESVAENALKNSNGNVRKAIELIKGE